VSLSRLADSQTFDPVFHIDAGATAFQRVANDQFLFFHDKSPEKKARPKPGQILEVEKFRYAGSDQTGITHSPGGIAFGRFAALFYPRIKLGENCAFWGRPSCSCCR